MPDPKILRAVQCGPHRILAAGSVPHQPQWLTESCCGPVVCHFYGRFVPCGTPSPDEACSLPPGKGVLYVCDQLLCTATSPATPGQPWPTPAPRPIVIRHMGRCWQFVPPFVTANQIPSGADVLDLGQTVECIGQSCADSPCGEPLEYAEALPCNPNYNGPRPLYCPAGLPFECGTLNPALEGLGNYNACFTFRRSAVTGAYPPNSPVIVFPPSASQFNGRTCCQCNCTGGPPLAHVYCGGPSPGGYCCPTTAAWNTGILLIDAVYRVEYPFSETGLVNHYTENRITGTTTPLNPSVTFTNILNYEIPGGDPVHQETSFTDLIQSVNCPLYIDWTTYIAVTPQPSYYACFETRAFNRWRGNWEARIPAGNPGDFRKITFVWDARVIASDPPGCSNDPCRGNLPIMPLTEPNQPTTGQASFDKANDLAVSAWMRKHYGGCAGCGDTPNPV